MRYRFLSYLLLGVLLAVAGLPRTAGAWSRPDIDFAVGRAFGANGDPSDGGMSVAIAPLWTAADRAHFGVNVFADDIGSTVGTLRDPNDQTSLGLVAERHRWTWGAAWRGDFDVVNHKRWAGSLTAQWGYWRMVDDVRGDPSRAASAVGLALGADVRHVLAGDHQVGVAVRWQRLFDQRHAAYQRADGYSTVALEWRWNAPRQP